MRICVEGRICEGDTGTGIRPASHACCVSEHLFLAKEMLHTIIDGLSTGLSRCTCSFLFVSSPCVIYACYLDRLVGAWQLFCPAVLLSLVVAGAADVRN